jgi:hypothetical protein
MGLPVAIPAATSAFGGAMAASTIAAPALLSAAAVTVPMAATGASIDELQHYELQVAEASLVALVVCSAALIHL